MHIQTRSQKFADGWAQPGQIFFQVGTKKFISVRNKAKNKSLA